MGGLWEACGVCHSGSKGSYAASDGLGSLIRPCRVWQKGASASVGRIQAPVQLAGEKWRVAVTFAHKRLLLAGGLVLQPPTNDESSDLWPLRPPMVANRSTSAAIARPDEHCHQLALIQALDRPALKQ